MLQMLQSGILLQMHITSVSQTAGGGGGGPPGVSNRNLAVHQESQTAFFFLQAPSYIVGHHYWVYRQGLLVCYVSWKRLSVRPKIVSTTGNQKGKRKNPKGHKGKNTQTTKPKQRQHTTEAKPSRTQGKTETNTTQRPTPKRPATQSEAGENGVSPNLTRKQNLTATITIAGDCKGRSRSKYSAHLQGTHGKPKTDTQ